MSLFYSGIIIGAIFGFAVGWVIYSINGKLYVYMSGQFIEWDV